MTDLLRRRLTQTLLLLPLAACAGQGATRLPAGTTLILLRHADRRDEDLTEIGRARAAALPGALAGRPIDKIYATGIRRNLETAAPLAAARGLRTIPLATTAVPRRLIQGNAGKTVVWIGNKGNLKAIWDALGAPGQPPLGYGQIAILTARTGGAPEASWLHFGPS